MNKKLIGAVLGTLALGGMNIAQAQDKPADAPKAAKGKKGKKAKPAGDAKGGADGKSCSGKDGKSCSGAK